MIAARGRGEAGLEASYRRALETFDLRVHTFVLEEERAKIAPTFGTAALRALRRFDLSPLNSQANRVLVMSAIERQPALLLVVGAETIRPATLVQLRVSVPGLKIVNIWPDYVFNITDAMFPCLPLYDLFCCHTRASVPELERAGCPGAHYLPLAADPMLHRPLELSAEDRREFGCDVAFVGNYRPEHGALFECLIGLDVAIWGPPTWKRAQNRWVRSCWRGREAFGTDYAKANTAARIALCAIDPLDRPGHNMRCFELPACGAFPLIQRTQEVLEFFREGETTACFGSSGELAEKVRHYLDRPAERERIAKAAHHHVLHNGHTYRDRVRSLFAALGITALLND